MVTERLTVGEKLLYYHLLKHPLDVSPIGCVTLFRDLVGLCEKLGPDFEDALRQAGVEEYGD